MASRAKLARKAFAESLDNGISADEPVEPTIPSLEILDTPPDDGSVVVKTDSADGFDPYDTGVLVQPRWEK